MENEKFSAADLLHDLVNAAASVNATAFWSNDSGLADSGPGPVIAARSIVDEECLDQEAVYFETDLQRVMENGDALPDATFCSADRGLAHVGLGPVNNQGVPVAFSILLALSALLWLRVIRRVLCIILKVDAVLHV